MYTYGSRLETASPRFSQPGDFFTYCLFVAGTIIVGLTSPSFRSLFLCPCPIHLHTARVVQLSQLLRFLKMRKIAPTLWLVRHSQKTVGPVHGVGMVGSSYEKTRVDSST